MSTRLESVSGERSVHPASRHIKLGFEHDTPVSAVRTLLSDEEVLSDSLHELTHFHSLASPIGAIFSTWSFLYKLASDDLAVRIRESRQGVELSLARCLHLGMRMEEAEEVWRPFLEGLAVYAQTSAPCTYLDTMTAPLETLRWFEVAVESLDPSAAGSSMTPPSSPIIEAGERVAGRGAGLKADDSLRLAEWVELSTDLRALPYFVGHAFVRALQADLRQSADDFDCAQVFLGLMFRILRGSWAHLVGRHGETIMHPGEAIPRLYDLTLDIFAEARPEEVRRLLEPGFDVDVLRWLELGQRVAPQPWDEQILARTMNEWFTAEWHLLGFPKGHQTPLSNALHAAILQTHIINMTSGGSCDVVAMVPSVEDASHACALDVDGATWWLVLNEDALKTLVDPADLVRLPAEAMRPRSPLPQRRNAARLQMHSFLRLRKISDVDNRVAWFLEVLLESPSGSTVLATLGPGPRGLGRAVLRAGGTTALKERDRLRELLETPLDCPNLSHWLEKQGFPILASSTRDNWAAHCARQEARRDQVNKTILKALLSLPEAAAEDVATVLTRERMRFALIESRHIQDLMVSSYASPILLTGPGAADTAEFLRATNKISRSKLGRPTFALENHPDLGMFVRYLGIWERTA